MRHAETDGQNEPNMQPVMELDVAVTCSAGTYIRALGRDLGAELGLGGHLTMLRRIRVGRFSVNMPNVMTAHTEAKTFTNREGIEVTRNRAVLDDAEHAVDHALDPVASAAASMDMLPVTEQEATDLRFGRRSPTTSIRPWPRTFPKPTIWWRSWNAPNVARPSRSRSSTETIKTGLHAMNTTNTRTIRKEGHMKTITLTPDASGMVDWPTLSNDKKSVVTIGSFDGMHQGHQAVIRRVAELAEQEQAFSVVVLFDPRPALVHAYAAKHDGQEPPAGTPDTQALTSVDERLRAIDAIGVDYTLIVRYTMAFSAKSYRFFLGQMVGKLGMRTLVLGSDAAMGANRAGNVKAIENLALATGVFQLEVVDDFGPGLTRVPVNAKPVMPSEPGEPSDPLEGASKAERRAWSKKHQAKEVRTWSSTNVRYLLSQGRIKDADAILGHAHAVEGTVVHGEERGRTIGFPTANLSDIAGYLPVDGVYAGWLVDLGEKSADGGEEAGEKPADGVSQRYDASSVNARVAMQSPHRWPAAISIGTKPTFNEDGDAERVVEAYAITDDWLDLYGHQARVEFAGFLRPQIKFDSADDLVVELKRNVEETKRLTA